MKHSVKIVIILLCMFFISQLIGLAVINVYSPQIKQVVDENGTIRNMTSYNLPFGTEPPEDIYPSITLISFIFAIVFAVAITLFLMKYKAELILRLWFFFVMALAIAITFNALILNTPLSSMTPYYSYLALILAIPLAFIKVFRRNLLVHNLTELIVYPGIAAIFVPLLNLWTIVLLLILISVYDIYAIWHAGFMQKMAKYQINTLKVFAGFFIPYVSPKDRALIKKMRNTKSASLKSKKIKVNVAILGGGDVIFPMILAGVVLGQFGFLSALIISLGATLALLGLFIMSRKGKFYPAMPFITIGCFLALGVVYLLQYL